jgi:hypothetical protein
VNRGSAGKSTRKAVFLGIGAAVTMLMAACSSPRPSVSVAMTTAPPSSLNVNQTAPVTATVANDSVSNGGVDWSCAPAGSCGTFSPTHTASGASTTYTAPASAASVAITATFTKDPTKTATATVVIKLMPISVTISTVPSSVYVNQTNAFGAAVANDSSNAGVDWSCTPAGSCGSFSPAHTASGAMTNYAAPASAASVTITATSAADLTKTASATFTVAPLSVSSLSGAYTFYAMGYNKDYDPSQVAGNIVLDGNGNVTGGEQDRADDDVGVDPDDPITGGTVRDEGNGRASITVTAASKWGTETFSVVFVNSKHLLITEFDANVNSQGSMDLQSASASVPMGGNAFALNDYEDEFSFGGVIMSDGTNIIAGEADDNSGSPDLDFNPSVANAITAPDASGRGTILLYDQAVAGNLQFAYYVVRPEAFRLVEIDGNFALVGSMFGQGTAADNFSAASLKGSFAFEQVGWTSPAYFAVAGQFTTDGISAFSSGEMDVNELADAPDLATEISGSTYGVSSDGYGSIALSPSSTYLANFGVYLVDPAINIADPNSSTGGGGALLTELDASDNGAGPGAGFAVPQQLSGATFYGNYAFNLGNGISMNIANNNWFDLIGQLVFDGTSNASGTADLSSASGAMLDADVSVTGTFTADQTNPGRFTFPLTVNGSANPNAVTIYQASSGLLLQVDMDPASSDGGFAIGVLEHQQ